MNLAHIIGGQDDERLFVHVLRAKRSRHVAIQVVGRGNHAVVHREVGGEARVEELTVLGSDLIGPVGVLGGDVQEERARYIVRRDDVLGLRVEEVGPVRPVAVLVADVVQAPLRAAGVAAVQVDGPGCPVAAEEAAACRVEEVVFGAAQETERRVKAPPDRGHPLHEPAEVPCRRQRTTESLMRAEG